MKHPLLIISIFLALPVFGGAGTIRGTVVDENGAPVPHMTVEISPIGMAWSGGIPQAVTDDQGRFVKEVVGPITSEGRVSGQRWALYPHQERDYYPHLTKFYETAANRAQEVELTPQKPEAQVELRLGLKAGALTGHATDAQTGAPLHPEFEFEWASDASKRMGKRTSDPFRILLPSNTAIKMTVSSEGYKTWSYPGTISIGPGQDMPLDIKLEPEPK